MKQHEKGTEHDNTSKPTKPSIPEKPPATTQPGKIGTRNGSAKDEMDVEEVPAKKKAQSGTKVIASNVNTSLGKKIHKLESDDEDEDFVTPTSKKGSATTPNKKLKSGSGKGIAQKIVGRAEKGCSVTSTNAKAMDVDESDEADIDYKDDDKSVKPSGRVRGGKMPSSAGKDDDGMKRMSLLARAADAALLHGQRETFEQGERNFNRFGGWLGKNSTMGKNYRFLEDLHVHLLASRESVSGRSTLRLDYLTILVKRLTHPLRMLPKDEAAEKVVEFMDLYSISMDDFDTIVEMSKFKGHPNPLDGIQPTVKAALTRAYNKGSSSRVVRAADLITLPGLKKAPKKRVAAMLEPIDDTLAGENGEENPSDTEDQAIRVQMDLKGLGSSSAKKGSSCRGKGTSDSKGGRGSGAASASASKRKR
ncbi:replication factor C subunit 1 [Orobanche gracilis]